MDKQNKRIVLVTGATGGLGTAMCKKLYKEGFRVIGNYRNKEKAKEWLELAVAIAPNQASLSFLGSAHARLGEKEAAKAAFRKVIELDDTYAEAYFNLGLLLSADGQAIEAERLLRKAAQLDPGSHRAHGALGVLLQELGKYSEAKAELRRALEIDPTDTIARRHLGLMTGDFK